MPTFGPLESIMRNEPIDFIGTDYSVGDRRLEETLLPLAQERKIGVMAYFPFDRRRIFERASSTPLPSGPPSSTRRRGRSSSSSTSSATRP
jgi:aryl-alcohol dehydrogenase-like predicted oxidoreductase